LDIAEKNFAEGKYESAGLAIPAKQTAEFDKDFTEAHRLINTEMEKTPKAAEPVLLQGDLYWSETHTNLAEAAYTKAIELNPELPLGYLSLARLYVSSHQDQQAIQRLNILASKTNQVATMMIGEIHQAAGRYPQARDAYEELLSRWPKTPLAMNNLAYIDAEYLDQIDRAFQLAQAALQLRPYDPYIADTLGWVLYKKHEYAHALTLIQESVDRNPAPDPEVLMHLGMAYYMMEEEGLARRYLQRSLAGTEDYPGKQTVRHRLEVLDINPTNATPTVFQELQSLMHDDPRDPVPLSRLASIEAQRGDIDAAISSLQDLLAINDQVWPAMIRLSRLYAEQKHDVRKALALAKSAHVLVPDDAGVCAWLGELIFRSGADYPWALSLLQQAQNQSLHQSSLDYDLAFAYYAVGRAKEADAAMQEALRENDSPSHAEEARQFVAMRAAVNDPDHAQASRPLAKQILAQDPNYVPALMVIALLEDRSGARDDALQTYDKVMSIYPNFAPAMREMAIIYGRSESKRDLERGYDLAERARSTFPDDAALAKTAGLLAFRLADYSRSVQLLLEASERSRNDGEVFYYLGMDYYKLNQPRQSKQSLQRALTMRLSETSETQARRVLSELK
jgi:tetratricopeptide (TPR) repeat protein